MFNLEEYINNKGSQNCGLFGGKFDGGYRVQQNPKELAECIKYIQEDCDYCLNNYVEIGCCAAGTTRIFSDIIMIDRIFVIDNGEEEEHKNHFIANFTNLKCSSYFSFIGDSHGAKCKEWLINNRKTFGTFDCAFIDGDHSYNGVRQDTELVAPFLSKNGYLLFHDTAGHYHPGVVEWVSQLKNGIMPEIKLVQDFVDPNRPIGLSLFRKN